MQSIILIFRSALESPTFTTWGSLSVKILGFFFLLPLILQVLPVEDVALWLLIQSIVMLLQISDFGFTPTFVRLISYSISEAKKNKSVNKNNENDPELVKYSIDELVNVMKSIYLRISYIVFFLTLTIGTLSVYKPISNSNNIYDGWLAWSFVVISSIIIARGGMYRAVLVARQKIQVFQRWLILNGILTILLTAVAVIMEGGLVYLVLITQAGLAVNVIITRKIAFKYEPRLKRKHNSLVDKKIYTDVWSSAWRSGLGVLISQGTMNGIGIVYAQVATPAESAAFLLAQRIGRTLNMFATVPFYNRISLMAKKYTEGDYQELKKIAKSGFYLCNWFLLIGVIVVGGLIDQVLEIANSETRFVEHDVWWLLGIALLLERVGAMHLQIYSTTNVIVWHIANGITSLLAIIACVILFEIYDLIGLPLGLIFGYVLFYLPYTMFLSYKSFKLRLVEIDLFGSLVPVLSLIFIFFIF